ncbi:MAG: DUF6465 family protein [Clostridium sp.]|nr:DUF6465 family protein [Clostridium sp.]
MAVKKENAAKEAEKIVKEVEKQTEEVKKAVKKTVDTAKSTAKKASTVARKATAAVKSTVYVQYAGREVDVAELAVTAKKEYMKKTGKKASEVKKIEIYVKPEENAAYYVVNGEGADDYKIEL